LKKKYILLLLILHKEREASAT